MSSATPNQDRPAGQRLHDLEHLDVEPHERLAGILNEAPPLVVSLTSFGAVRFINRRLQQLTGFAGADLLGQIWWSLCESEASHEQMLRLLPLVEAGDVHGYELPLVTQSGELRQVRWDFVRLLDEDGSIREIVGWGVDITQPYVTPELEPAVAPQSCACPELLAVAGYELRSALTLLLGRTQLLQRRALRSSSFAEDDREHLQLLAGHALKLNRKIELIFRMLSLQHAAQALVQEPVDALALVHTVVEQCAWVMMGHPLELSVPSGLLVVQGEFDLLEHMLVYMLENAAIASPEASSIQVRLEASPSEVRLLIVDRGPLPSDEELASLFLPEPAALAAHSRMRIGSGLYSAHLIAGLHGGTLELAPNERRECCMCVTLPRTALHE